MLVKFFFVFFCNLLLHNRYHYHSYQSSLSKEYSPYHQPQESHGEYTHMRFVVVEHIRNS